MKTMTFTITEGDNNEISFSGDKGDFTTMESVALVQLLLHQMLTATTNQPKRKTKAKNIKL